MFEEMEIVSTAFEWGQRAEVDGQLHPAINHYSRALNVFHSVGGYKYDPIFWSKILFSRAGVFLKLQRYNDVENDVKQALMSCPQQQCDLEEAELWFRHAMNVHSSLAVWCLSAALHFAAGETFFQSQIYTYRALYHHELGHETECDQDLEESKKLDFRATRQTGVKVKTQAMGMVHNRSYGQAVVLLQFAEKIFRPPYHVGPSLYNYWNECWKNIILALWSGKMYAKAVQAGKTWRQMEPITNQQESIDWKEKGNEIFKQEKYDTAIDCYHLSIKYAPGNDAHLLGTLYGNRSQAYFKKRKFTKAKEDAERCLNYRPNWSKGFYRLGSALMALKNYDRALVILKKGLNMCQMPNEKYEIFQKIMTLVFNSEDGPMKITFKLPCDCLSRYLEECVQKHHWKSLEVFLLGGGGPQSYAKGKGGIATNNCDLKEISLCDVIRSNPKPSMYYKLINVLIDHGVLVNGRSEKEIPLLLSVNYDDHDLAVNLLKKNANPEGLIKSKYGKPDDTPIHTAFRIGLSSGHWEIFHFLVEPFGSPTNTATNAPCLEILDRKGNSLYHVVAYGERLWDHAVEGINLLKKYNVDPKTRNKDGKTPLMMVRRNKDKCRLIEECVKSFASDHDNRKKKKKKKKKAKIIEKIAIATQSECKKDENVNQVVIPSLEEVLTPALHCPTETESLREKISQAIKHLPSAEMKNENKTRESNGSEKESTSAEIDQHATNSNNESGSLRDLSCNVLTAQNKEVENKVPLSSKCLKVDPLPEDDDEKIDTDDVVDDVCNVTFDKLTWEVECTSEVWKKLNDKKLPNDKKKQIVKIIRQLANGYMRGSRAKRLVGIAKESNILLFEAKLDKSARIIWERAIAFSPRCSENTLPDNKNGKRSGIYTDVIRIWDIVFDHDTVPRKIKKIVHSYNRGTSCFIKKNLKGKPLDSSSLSTNNDYISIPNIYVPREDTEKLPAEYLKMNEKPCSADESSKLFFPPGSPEETEYHILKFYEFSNAMVNAMLDNQNKINLDFPFRVSELEHSVINLMPKPMTSILLLGRSGTGKTTCCLYRLWNNYQTYWQHHTLDDPSIPKVAQFIPRDFDGISDAENNAEDRNELSTYEERSDVLLHDAPEDQQGCSSKRFEKELKSGPPVKQQDAQALGNVSCQDSCTKTDENEDLQHSSNKQTFEHLHQAFITKNAVLCKEVQKNFLELSNASFSTRDDVNHQQSSSVYKFDQLEEQAWPLFICSRDWLLMLDASLPGKPFFPRDENGKLHRTVKGWGEEDNNLHEILVEYSEDEDEDDDENESSPTAVDGERHEQQTDGELDPRREVTYQVFKNELWKKMTKKNKVDYHPSLVWTEIISFIKGSVEALHSKDGCITLEDYQDIGNKRAPSFTADRETIYKLFLAYEDVKCRQVMFDEADVVNHIYHRLEHNIPTWSIHEIYVDETQDFTQAELSVIIRSSRNPNRLFFTGDTAQSIMRGIAFRFRDLRSLFYYMRESVKAVGEEAKVVVPDRIYELTHNYRSHAGILNLASSVTDLLSYFFPESFDRLARDQGLFEGPKPVLLESCSFSDLAVILRGHKRKTSPIEFGAHQVILVASNEVRDSLPEELGLALVMTIYEAKGLEFDDVLIYNFFKDSQALKEWRVVSTYKENDCDVDNVSATGIAEIPIDNVECKSRPLEFNPNQHKILISEFKYLYTALTRARVNVWLFDENVEARAPMFEYFQRRGVVDVKHVQTTEDDKASLEGMFAQASSKEEWKKQGLFFYGKGVWNVASKCFAMADEEVWKKKCHAHEQAANAASFASEPRKLKLEFVKAADLFLECDMKDEAAKCLYNARERILLAQLYEKCGNFLKAAKIFQKDREFLNAAARNFERAGDFERAVDCLLKVNDYTEVLHVVSRCEDLMKFGQENSISKPLRFDQRAESISYQAAKFHQKRGDLHLMTVALERLPNVEDRITFLQKNSCFDQAAELLLKEGKPSEAARLMRSKGKFLEAARFSDDDKFVADCYLLTARSTVLSKKNSVRSKETEELIEGSLERAAEFYKRCNNVNGQAEVKLALGKFYGRVEDLEEAVELYRQASNYAALAESFLLLVDIHEKDPRKISRSRASWTLHDLLYLILSLYKKSPDNSERTAISMCYVYFGLIDTGDAQTKKVPHLEMVKFTDLQNVETIQEELIPTKEAEKFIKNHLIQMARNLIEQLWNVNQQINKSSTSCPRFIAGSSCDFETSDNHHDNLRREEFGDRFYALLFLVRLEDRISKFLKNMKRESAKVANQLRKRLFIFPEFEACNLLCELLFPRGEQLVASYFLSQRDVSILRERVSDRIIEYAKSFLWDNSEEKERWSSSDLFIDVSNLIHIAGARVGYVYSLLRVEERKFENGDVADHPGVFRDRRNRGRFNIFSKALERSKSRLYSSGDVQGSIHAAIKEFLFSPAKRKGLPYPSIANAVMILERQLTACLVLYARLRMNETFVCLPESYLSMINFWDYVDRPQTNRSTTLYNAIHCAPKFFQGSDGQYKFAQLCELARSMVELTVGQISRKYNIVRDALGDISVPWIEAERVLVLALTMLCNCGCGIPEECERIIREQILTLQVRQDLPQKLTKCIEDVRSATGVQDVVVSLRELLNHEPLQESLCDVKWDEFKGKDFRLKCDIQRYSEQFRFEIDVNALLANTRSRKPEEQETAKNDVSDHENYPQLLSEEETVIQRQEYSEDEQIHAILVLQRALLKWKHRKEAKAKLEREIKNDAVKCHFQSFKLDKSGCTICSQVQFVERDSNLASTTSSEPSSLVDHDEEMSMNWQPRILPRNTFEAHCARKSPHWKREKSLAKFKKIYKEHVLPTIERATKLEEEMRKLRDETEMKCYLDLDRLEDVMDRLQINIKKVEDAREWDSVSLIHEAAKEVSNMVQYIRSRKGIVKSHYDGVHPTQDSGDEDLTDDGPFALKNIHSVRQKNKKFQKSKRRR